MANSDEAKKANEIRRVGIVFAGGPAPAANAVISAAAISFLEDGRQAYGFFHGYSNLLRANAGSEPLRENEHYRVFSEKDVRGLRNSRGIMIGTSRANPGKPIKKPADLHDAEKTEGLRQVYQQLVDHGIDALISIGGDDTLKTANLLYEYQKTLPEDAPHVRIVHLPKTIDNDYRGIDFTFGFFTAVDVMAREVQNLRADAISTGSYFVVETMGRKAGWLSYGVAIAGEANLVIGVEDLDETLSTGEGADKRLNVTALVDRIVELVETRESRGKHYGVIVLAEGLAEMLPDEVLEGLPRDDHGHLSLAGMNLAKLVCQKVMRRYEERTGRRKKITGLQFGYESRCAPPHAFDVMLGSQLGIGAYRALVEEGLDGHMVSVSGQLDLEYVPFSEIVDQETLLTEVRFIEPGSDFHKLARFLETRTSDRAGAWRLPRREEGPR